MLASISFSMPVLHPNVGKLSKKKKNGELPIRLPICAKTHDNVRVFLKKSHHCVKNSQEYWTLSLPLVFRDRKRDKIEKEKKNNLKNKFNKIRFSELTVTGSFKCQSISGREHSTRANERDHKCITLPCSSYHLHLHHCPEHAINNLKAARLKKGLLNYTGM